MTYDSATNTCPLCRLSGGFSCFQNISIIFCADVPCPESATY